MSEKLTPKQERFVDEYMIDMNAAKASVRAGYASKRSDSWGYQLLGNPKISEAIRERREKQAKESWLTVEKLMNDIELIKQDAMKTREGKDGQPVMIDRAAALKAAELQGRRLGAFNDKLNVQGSIQIQLIDEFPD